MKKLLIILLLGAMFGCKPTSQEEERGETYEDTYAITQYSGGQYTNHWEDATDLTFEWRSSRTKFKVKGKEYIVTGDILIIKK